MKIPHAKEATQCGDVPSQQGGQFIDITFMAPKNGEKASRRTWQQKSLDSPEFGFASSLVSSTELAPADELFFKGQLLPLQLDHRLHLVQALASSSSSSHEKINPGIARVGSSRLAHDLWCENGEVIEFNSCRLEREVSLEYLKERSSSCKSKGDCGAFTVDQIAVRGSGSDTLSWYHDEDLHSFNDCSCKGGSMSDALTDTGSSSFHSNHSGFWDSGADKDLMDSSSSRDSNGSSQDSYFHSQNTQIEDSSYAHSLAHPQHKKLSLNIPWKLPLWRRGRDPCRMMAAPQVSFTKVGFSEDLSLYKTCVAPPLNEVKEALLPWKVVGDGHGEQRRLRSTMSSNASRTSTVKCLTNACISSARKLSPHDGSKSFRMSKDGSGTGAAPMDESKKPRRMNARERWQMCASRLKHLYGSKRGFMGQFRMDECGRRADCAVEDWTIYPAARPGQDQQVQKRLSHQSSSSSLVKGSNPVSQAQNQANSSASTVNFRVLAIASSCPTTIISSSPSPSPSASHCGLPVAMDSNQRISTHKHANPSKLLGLPLKSLKGSGSGLPNGSTGDRSMSTMHELQSSLQSAIAHCKESHQQKPNNQTAN